MPDNPDAVIIIADSSRQQWLYALLSRYYHVHTVLPSDDDHQNIDLYFFDEVTLEENRKWLEEWRKNVQPDSPPVLLLCDRNHPEIPAEQRKLVDEILPADIEAEQLREHINQWLRLRDSVQVWLKASNTHQVIREPLSHPSSALNNIPTTSIPVTPEPNNIALPCFYRVARKTSSFRARMNSATAKPF